VSCHTAYLKLATWPIHTEIWLQGDALRVPQPEDWRDRIPDAHRVIEEWEANTRGRMLSMRDLHALAEHIAKALQDAFERGRDS
jgi:hypothetical protein